MTTRTQQYLNTVERAQIALDYALAGLGLLILSFFLILITIIAFLFEWIEYGMIALFMVFLTLITGVILAKVGKHITDGVKIKMETENDTK